MRSRFILVLAGMFAFCISATDLNIHQMQMVADNLYDDECIRLAETLHRSTLIRPMSVAADVRRVPCIVLLLQWDRTSGAGKSFHVLTEGLLLINREDLADKLASSVYAEMSDTLHRNFLDDPFRNDVPDKSFLLDAAEKEIEVSPVTGNKKEEESSRGLAFGIAVAVITGIFCLALVFYLFKSSIKQVWNKCAPDLVKDWCDLIQYSWCGRPVEKDATKMAWETRRQAEKLVDDLNKNSNSNPFSLRTQRHPVTETVP